MVVCESDTAKCDSVSKLGKTFDIFVIAVVMFTGAGFGALTGLFYSESYWWVGMMAGFLSGYPLAKLYLRQLVKISAKGYNRKVTWLLCTFVAVICGVICTTIIHGIMTVIMASNINSTSDSELLIDQMDGVWLIFLGVAELVGACAGLVVGGICSYIYLLLEKGKSNEPA